MTVIRSLARADQKAIIGVNGDAATCNYSRYINGIWEHPDYSINNNDFIVALLELLSGRNEITSVVPVGEVEARLFVTNFADISSNVKVQICDPELVAVCLDKSAMSEVVDQLGIPQFLMRLHQTVKRSSILPMQSATTALSNSRIQNFSYMAKRRLYSTTPQRFDGIS